jgi:hypothetical protein
VAVTPAQITAAFPAFDLVAVTSVFITLAASDLDSNYWGTIANYYKAQAYLAMHMMVKAGLSSSAGSGGSDGGAAGPVTSERAGKIARSYGKPSISGGHAAADEDLASTKFGLMFIRLRDTNAHSGPGWFGPGVNVSIDGGSDS